MHCDLTNKRCVPCEGGVPALQGAELADYLGQIEGWTSEDDRRIHKSFGFGDFAELMVFVNRMAEVAETEGHHPDFSVHYSELDVTLWTHAVGGLSENDFILAAKIDATSTR